MTDQEKLRKLTEILRDYQGDEIVFGQPPEETEQQKRFREDLHAVVAIVFKEDANISSDLSVAELKARLERLWQETKPEGWK